MLLPLMIGSALAAIVESSPTSDRPAAIALRDAVQTQLADGQQARLVRRFYQGEGWRYLVVIEGVETHPAAARLVAGIDGINHIDAPAATSSAATSSAATSSAQSAAPAIEDEVEPESPRIQPGRRGSPSREADNILRQAIKAHGGAEGAGVVLKSASKVSFKYIRAVPEANEEPLIAQNLYQRSGDACRLEVDIQQGQGLSSLTVLTPEGQGVVVVGGQRTERDGARTREILGRFSPESVLAIPLGLPEDVETAAAWRSLELADDSDAEQWHLVGDGADGLIEARFDPDTRLLQQVVWGADGGNYVFSYGDYREVEEGLIIPFEVQIDKNGTRLEDITIQELLLEPALTADLFAPPAG